MNSTFLLLLLLSICVQIYGFQSNLPPISRAEGFGLSRCRYDSSYSSVRKRTALNLLPDQVALGAVFNIHTAATAGVAASAAAAGAGAGALIGGQQGYGSLLLADGFNIFTGLGVVTTVLLAFIALVFLALTALIQAVDNMSMAEVAQMATESVDQNMKQNPPPQDVAVSKTLIEMLETAKDAEGEESLDNGDFYDKFALFLRIVLSIPDPRLGRVPSIADFAIDTTARPSPLNDSIGGSGSSGSGDGAAGVWSRDKWQGELAAAMSSKDRASFRRLVDEALNSGVDNDELVAFIEKLKQEQEQEQQKQG